MTRDPITVMPSETPEHAASLIRRHNVGAIPVIHGAKSSASLRQKTS
jgi:CBS domain-containing protein